MGETYRAECTGCRRWFVNDVGGSTYCLWCLRLEVRQRQAALENFDRAEAAEAEVERLRAELTAANEKWISERDEASAMRAARDSAEADYRRATVIAATERGRVDTERARVVAALAKAAEAERLAAALREADEYLERHGGTDESQAIQSVIRDALSVLDREEARP